MTPPAPAGRLLLAAAMVLLSLSATAGDAPAAGHPRKKTVPAARIDHSGRTQTGKASFYAPHFAGRKMADGTPMNPHRDNAASRTLPLGTRAVVTNLENGRSAMVTIQDRGPYVDGRIVDLSPATAARIGLSKQQGLARVEVAPVAVPQPDGSVRPGLDAQTASAR